MKNARTFLAIDILPGQRKKASRIIGDLNELSDQFKWSRDENLHITLNFLGDVPETELNNVCQAASRAVEDVAAFDIQIEGLGAFPEVARPRVIWLGITEGQSELQQLQRKLEQALEPLGFPPERRLYRPHLTLGRIKRSGKSNPHLVDYLRTQSQLSIGGCSADCVVAYSSFLDRSGPTYTALTTIDLA